jgi:hypothetical protein
VVGWRWPSGAHEQGLRLPGEQVGRGGGAAGQGDAGEQLAPRAGREVNQARCAWRRISLNWSTGSSNGVLAGAAILTTGRP